jgi:hypothetical protein
VAFAGKIVLGTRLPAGDLDAESDGGLPWPVPDPSPWGTWSLMGASLAAFGDNVYGNSRRGIGEALYRRAMV